MGARRRVPRAFPQIEVEPDRIFVPRREIWTSAGITAGIDLALALVAEDLGEAVARRAAQQLVVYHRRPGGQSQFSALLETDRTGGRFSPLLAWVRERLDERLPVERLADQRGDEPAAFRPRLQRRDRHDAGEGDRAPAPGGRPRAGRGGADPIEGVAEATGFGDPERMRRAFMRAFGQPPQALRRAARRGEVQGRKPAPQREP